MLLLLKKSKNPVFSVNYYYGISQSASKKFLDEIFGSRKRNVTTIKNKQTVKNVNVNIDRKENVYEVEGNDMT